MTLVSNLSDDIPGLLKAALIFNGETPGGKSASLAILTDGDEEALIDLGNGLNARGDGLTQAMRSYISGLSQVGQILKSRKIEDEDGVTEDDLERAALLFAFPKVGQNAKALAILKSHLDALQDKGIVAKADGTQPAPKPKPKMDAPKKDEAAKVAAPTNDAPATDAPEIDEDADDQSVIEKVAEAATPLTLVAAGAGAAAAATAMTTDDDTDEGADDQEDIVEAEAMDDAPITSAAQDDEDAALSDDAEEDADDAGNGSLEEIAATDSTADEDTADEVKAEAPPRPSPAQVAQARLNSAPRKPSFFGR